MKNETLHPALAGQVERGVRPRPETFDVVVFEDKHGTRHLYSDGAIGAISGPSADDRIIASFSSSDAEVSKYLRAELVDVLQSLRRLRDALLDCARRCEALKRPWGMDPGNGQALRNGQYLSIALAARAALGPNVKAEQRAEGPSEKSAELGGITEYYK